MVSEMHWCFDIPKAESLSYVTSPIQKEKIKTVVLLILTSYLKQLSEMVLILILNACVLYAKSL